jgi:hypothetical protein
MMNQRMIGKYFRLSEITKVFRVDEYHYNHGKVFFSGYILDTETAEITKCDRIMKCDLGEMVSAIEIDAIVDQLSIQSGLLFCF